MNSFFDFIQQEGFCSLEENIDGIDKDYYFLIDVADALYKIIRSNYSDKILYDTLTDNSNNINDIETLHDCQINCADIYTFLGNTNKATSLLLYEIPKRKINKPTPSPINGKNDPTSLKPRDITIPKTPNTATNPRVRIIPINNPFRTINSGDKDPEDLLN